MNTQDVIGSELLDLALNCLQVRPQLIALKNILHHHRFKAWGHSRTWARESDRTCFYSTKTPKVAQKNYFQLKTGDNICCHISDTSLVCEQDVRMTGEGKHINTCCDHGFETGLLVNARPDDVAGFGSPMAKRQEAQSQAHSRRHGNYEAARHTPDTCNPEETKHAYCTCSPPITPELKGAIHIFTHTKICFIPHYVKTSMLRIL